MLSFTDVNSADDRRYTLADESSPNNVFVLICDFSQGKFSYKFQSISLRYEY